MEHLDRRGRQCPLYKKECSKYWDSCAFAVENSRTYETGSVVLIKVCALWSSVSELENHSNRMAMMQKEMGETKNAAVFHALAALANGGDPEAVSYLQRQISKVFFGGRSINVKNLNLNPVKEMVR